MCRAYKWCLLKPNKCFRLACVALLVVILPVAAFASNWFENETRRCEWESPAAEVIPAPFSRGKTNSGGDYVSVSKAQINAILQAPSNVVFAGAPLTSAQVSALKRKVEDARAAPIAAKIALKMTGSISSFSGVFGVVAGGLLKWLSANAEALLINIDRFQDFVAAGGIGGYELAFKIPAIGLKPLIYFGSVYEIQVGAEPRPRRWLLSACLIPVELLLQEVETTAVGPNANNKKLIKQGDGSWRMWDITDQKYNANVLHYDGQDEQFAYFTVTNGDSLEYRVHLYGGPMQLRRRGENWATVYATSDTR